MGNTEIGLVICGGIWMYYLCFTYTPALTVGSILESLNEQANKVRAGKLLLHMTPFLQIV